MNEPYFVCKNDDILRFPILLCAPHAGRNYPSEILENSRISPTDMVRLEDRYSDLLLRSAESAGFTTVTALRARCWTDLNRSEDDLDRQMLRGVPDDVKLTVSAKQRGGLGLIPRRLHPVGEIWKRPFDYSEAVNRIESYHRPYHAAVTGLLARMRARFGGAVLLDIHSMPPVTKYSGDQRPEFVVGDRFGSSAASRFAEMLQAQMAANDRCCALNHPYAGDFILRNHGDPSQNIHALQLETCRSLYLDSAMREPGPGLANTQSLVLEVAQLMADVIADDELLIAAE